MGKKSLRITKGFKVILVDFRKKSKEDDDFKNCVGLYFPQEQKAYVDKNLPKYSHGTRELCKHHELVHHRLRELEYNTNNTASIFKNNNLYEQYIELEAIVRTPGKWLSKGEEAIKKYITENKRLSPNINKDLSLIIKNIFRILKVKSTNYTIKLLVNGKI